ncbi:MAG: hypothetical protein ACOYJU_07000, partial [Anaerovoracaceae bacterium]
SERQGPGEIPIADFTSGTEKVIEDPIDQKDREKRTVSKPKFRSGLFIFCFCQRARSAGTKVFGIPSPVLPGGKKK